MITPVRFTPVARTQNRNKKPMSTPNQITFAGEETHRKKANPIKTVGLAAALLAMTPNIVNAQYKYTDEERHKDRMKIEQLGREAAQAQQQATAANWNFWGTLDAGQKDLVKKLQNVSDLSIVTTGRAIPPYNVAPLLDAMKIEQTPMNQALAMTQLDQIQTYHSLGITTGDNPDKIMLTMNVNNELNTMLATTGQILKLSPDNIGLIGCKVKAKPSDFYSIARIMLDYTQMMASTGMQINLGDYSCPQCNEVEMATLELGKIMFVQHAEEFFKPILPLVCGN